jgi:hypothetical protein
MTHPRLSLERTLHDLSPKELALPPLLETGSIVFGVLFWLVSVYDKIHLSSVAAHRHPRHLVCWECTPYPGQSQQGIGDCECMPSEGDGCLTNQTLIRNGLQGIYKASGTQRL